ncbi:MULTISPECIES: DUF2490 domain-containing protein [Olivibacter]|jgi:hypothetical protein|uniref:DUF2490 domain-containing protein n=1 Tax=Olivibacter oleidegradans TaxID=760123 RepID=A0ABV6HRJ7_9SPHI|nr:MULTISPECIES: DUF2490 domain-containing protein [Olivibacter]MDM8176170.1 DUF2490 domain-containing protein [Olivibacter sp. 47]QEL00931.1 DUF2490 domain-containing protein [Olivibacter sp. LS-1]
MKRTASKFVNTLFGLMAIICLLIPQTSIKAQDNQFGNWYAWFNNIKFNAKWGMNNDIQFRAGKNWNENSLILIRPGVNYYVSANQTASAGYATTLVTHKLTGDQPRLTEHRIWEQYIITGRLLNIPVQHRFRLEQRFLKRPDESVFTQRARYFIRGIIPINSPLQQPFNKGWFLALQNELFFNIQNKDNVNGSLFDQNRAYAAFGYRFSPKYDLEIGYMNQFSKRNTQPNLLNHIAQIAFYTRL